MAPFSPTLHGFWSVALEWPRRSWPHIPVGVRGYFTARDACGYVPLVAAGRTGSAGFKGVPNVAALSIPSGRRGAEPSYISGSESSRCLGQEPEDLPPAWAFGAVPGRAAADTCAVIPLNSGRPASAAASSSCANIGIRDPSFAPVR
jgi:hypothetical protein